MEGKFSGLLTTVAFVTATQMMDRVTADPRRSRVRVASGRTALYESIFDLAFAGTAQDRGIAWRFGLRNVGRTATCERPVHVLQIGCRYRPRNGGRRRRSRWDGEHRRHWEPQWPVHTSMLGKGQDSLHRRGKGKRPTSAAAQGRDFEWLVPG